MTSSITKETEYVVVNGNRFATWDNFIFTFLSLLSFVAIFNLLRHWFFLEKGVNYPVTFAILTLILIVKLLDNQSRWFLLPFMKIPNYVRPRAGWKVGVVTTFVPGVEPLDMLEKTVKALIALEYPHDTWVLDEGNDVRVKALCQRLGAHHFSRKNRTQYQSERGTFQSRSRHGNYNSWLNEIGFERYEIMTQFDSDHVPDPSFLSEVLNYFEDPKIGYVQVAQVYYNQNASFIARGAAEETYAYYSSTQMTSYAMGYTAITGCHSTHRVTALKQVGGFAVHDADDLLITFFYRSHGWQGVYVPKTLAKGLTPVDWEGYLTQQLKWARSVLDIKFRIYPKLMERAPLRTQVMRLLHGISYIEDSLITCMGLALTAYMLATGNVPNVVSYRILADFAVLIAVLLICDLYRQRFYLNWRRELGFHWRAFVLHYAKWPYILLALYQVVLNQKFPYPLNPKVRTQSRRRMWLWPHLLVAILIAVAWAIGLSTGRALHPLLHVWAGIVVVGSLSLIFTEIMNFPDPFDLTLMKN